MEISCPACAETLPAVPALRGIDRLHGLPGAYDVAVCTHCGSGRTLPVLEPARLAALYPDEYAQHSLPTSGPARTAATALFRLRYRRALRRDPLASLQARPPGRLLDVGSGRGDLGVVLQELGWRITGLEPSERACEDARSRGVESICGTLHSHARSLAGDYDAIVFEHSLEHVTEPAGDLAVAQSLLAAGGLLLISVPNFGTWQRRWFDSYWFHLDLPRHRSHFTRRGLETLIRRVGFAPPRLSTSSTIDGLPMSIQYRLFGRRRLTSNPGRYGALALAGLLLPVFAASNAVAGEGDVLHAVATSGPGGG